MSFILKPLYKRRGREGGGMGTDVGICAIFYTLIIEGGRIWTLNVQVKNTKRQYVKNRCFLLLHDFFF